MHVGNSHKEQEKQPASCRLGHILGLAAHLNKWGTESSDCCESHRIPHLCNLSCRISSDTHREGDMPPRWWIICFLQRLGLPHGWHCITWPGCESRTTLRQWLASLVGGGFMFCHRAAYIRVSTFQKSLLGNKNTWKHFNYSLCCSYICERKQLWVTLSNKPHKTTWEV